MAESVTGREMFSAWLKVQIAENANPYPTGVQAFLAGVVAERERIIALLEVDATTGMGSEYCDLPLDEEHCHWCFEVVRLIALIKGETE